ncbi:Synaptobrevin-like protein ykt6 [Golovinomyces cichoracearum]|uniref:Synaptobrevin homolog YKT6 n=1 Tax=Golovinomyces cichoracearum TaxID=62708 RepID=A0A420IWG8_9PEZI|nr:Synaptobrevin-like protein ykt6 [Golovinomyces cichoracearum]
MKLHYIGIIKNESKPSHELVAEKDLSAYSRFTRNKYVAPIYLCKSYCVDIDLEENIQERAKAYIKHSYGEFMSMFSKTVAERTRPGQRQDVEEQDYTFHAYGRSEGVCGIIISDHAYPALVAHQLLSKMLDEFLSLHPKSEWGTTNPTLSFPALKDYLIKYQDPQQADSIMKIQKELDETKIVLHKTIESVLQRGEKIDDLVAKSDGLSAQSKMFYTQAKKQNSCCVLM